MKWGVRRYQNADGTLTAEGRRRYNIDAAPGTETKRSREKRSYEAAKLDYSAAQNEWLANHTKNDDKKQKQLSKAKVKRTTANELKSGLGKHEASLGMSKLLNERNASVGGVLMQEVTNSMDNYLTDSIEASKEFKQYQNTKIKDI